MASIDLHWHRTIQRMLAQCPDARVSDSINLWKELASTLTLTVGDVGFQTLFSSSIHITGKTFPWMTGCHVIHANESGFDELRTRLDGQVITESSAASALLLNTFFGKLILLIGEELTASILRSVLNDWPDPPAPF